MKNMRLHNRASVCLFVLQLFFAGCMGTSAPSRFYALHSLDDTTSAERVPASSQTITLAIGPVEIPDYLNSPEITTRTGQNELKLAQYDRWAGSLKDNIERVLAENLVLLLAGNDVSAASWHWRAASDYRIAVYITRFDIMADGYVLMNAYWDIIGKDGSTVLHAGKSMAKEPITAETYSARVESMSRALGRLSRDIAGGMKTVSQKK